MSLIESSIKSLSFDDKLNIYMKYSINLLALKHNFNIVDKSCGIDYKIGRRNPDTEFNNIALYYHWKDISIMSFEEFISDNNYKVIDLGVKWKEQGYAQRHFVQLSGIYDYVEKFGIKKES